MAELVDSVKKCQSRFWHRLLLCLSFLILSVFGCVLLPPLISSSATLALSVSPLQSMQASLSQLSQLSPSPRVPVFLSAVVPAQLSPSPSAPSSWPSPPASSSGLRSFPSWPVLHPRWPAVALSPSSPALAVAPTWPVSLLRCEPTSPSASAPQASVPDTEQPVTQLRLHSSALLLWLRWPGWRWMVQLTRSLIRRRPREMLLVAVALGQLAFLVEVEWVAALASLESSSSWVLAAPVAPLQAELPQEEPLLVLLVAIIGQFWEKFALDFEFQKLQWFIVQDLTTNMD